MTALKLQDVTVTVNGTSYLKAVNLTIRAGECVALIGANGAGKSTLLRVAAGLVRPGHGRVDVMGAALQRTKPAQLAGLRALMGQSQDIPVAMRVEALIRIGMGVAGQDIPADRRNDILEQMLEAVALSDRRDQFLSTLSGGERQRAHLARVLAQLEAGFVRQGKPGLLLLDEPLSAQDIPNQLVIMQRARAHAARGGGVFAVLHDLNWAAAWSDRVIIIDHGRICADGPPGQVINQETLARHFRMPNVNVEAHHISGRPHRCASCVFGRWVNRNKGEKHVYRHQPLQGETRLHGSVRTEMA